MGVTHLRAARKPVEPWQLRIELLEIKPCVWRRLLVPSNIKLPALHRVFQAALGWTNSHLHEFVIGGVRYAAPDPDWSEELKQVSERGIVLNAALSGESRCFDYVYDFGDDWHHAVLVEDAFIPPQAEFTTECIAGENACPPEDVGGAHRYAEFLAAIADPRHEEHDNYLAWCGGSFDPARFDRDAVNRVLTSMPV
jgi:hypothetical protein